MMVATWNKLSQQTRQLAICGLVLNFLDIVTTIFGVSTHIARELNPLMAAALDVGIPFFIVVKLFVFVAVLTYALRQKSDPNRFLCILDIAYLAVVAWNLLNIALHFL